MKLPTLCLSLCLLTQTMSGQTAPAKPTAAPSAPKPAPAATSAPDPLSAFETAPSTEPEVSPYDLIVANGGAQIQKNDLTAAMETVALAIKLDDKRYEAYALAALIRAKQQKEPEAKMFLDMASSRVPPEKRDQLDDLVVKIVQMHGPVAGKVWINTMGMNFAPVPDVDVLFSIWDTRVQDFAAFVQATGYDAKAGMISTKTDPATHKDTWQQNGDNWNSPGFQQGPTSPVCGVSWNDAKAFCAWLTKKERAAGKIGGDQAYRLPTDAEWSAAVGLNEPHQGSPQSKDGKSLGVYAWGNLWPPPDKAGNFADASTRQIHRTWTILDGYDDGYPNTSPVGSFAANPIGLYDMSGNVWQWCEDFYDGVHGSHVARGGAFNSYDANQLQASCRSHPDDGRYDIIGFRCVVTVNGMR